MRLRKKLTEAQALVKKRWRDKNPKYVSPNVLNNKNTTRSNFLKKRYGIDLSEYNRLLLAQGHKCAICLAPSGSHGRRLAVDHCHETGRIRGLLCLNCNQGLGKFKDSKILLTKAMAYLDEKLST